MKVYERKDWFATEGVGLNKFKFNGVVSELVNVGSEWGLSFNGRVSEPEASPNWMERNIESAFRFIGNCFSANPSAEATQDLKLIKLNNTTYKVGS